MRALIVWLVLAGCAAPSREAGSAAPPITAEADLGTAECAACGMVVREQPAPRAQVVHRDGHRAFLCSISDLAHYGQAPSPHGAITHTFVEVLAPEEPADPPDRGPHRWVPVEAARAVIGLTRRGVMGVPVLLYETEAAALAAVSRHGGRVAGSWTELSRSLISTDEKSHPNARSRPR